GINLSKRMLPMPICILDTDTDCGIISITMNVYLGHLSNCIPGSPVSTAVRSILDDAQAASKRAPQHLPERTLPVRLPAGTVEWLRQQAERQACAMAKVIRAYVADQAVSELTALYQHHTVSPAEFSAVLWSVLGYEPEPSPGEEVREST
ncbi:MAG: hypothetical protein KAX26_05250, partial [Anaerolineae bacterium]|nr:hypothetical protein [Anaerolineae bacterium]